MHFTKQITKEPVYIYNPTVCQSNPQRQHFCIWLQVVVNLNEKRKSPQQA